MTVENDDKNSFIWSISASLGPCRNSHPNGASNYRDFFKVINIQDFDFTNGCKYSDMHNFEKLNNSSINKMESKLYQDQNKEKHKVIPFEFSKIELGRVEDLMIYKNHYALIKNLPIFLGNHNCNFVCRRCLISYTSQNVIIKHRQQYEQQKITSIKISKNLTFFGKRICIKIH